MRAEDVYHIGNPKGAIKVRFASESWRWTFYILPGPVTLPSSVGATVQARFIIWVEQKWTSETLNKLKAITLGSWMTVPRNGAWDGSAEALIQARADVKVTGIKVIV